VKTIQRNSRQTKQWLNAKHNGGVSGNNEAAGQALATPLILESNSDPANIQPGSCPAGKAKSLPAGHS
jgi:hypothetical protein